MHNIGADSVRSVLGDAGCYAYCAICAKSLHDLFKEPWNRSFCEEVVSGLIEHVGLPQQVAPSLLAIVGGQDCQEAALVEVLRSEPALGGSCLRVLEDLVLFAVRGGVYDARLRVLIIHVSWLLRVPLPLVEIYEESVVDRLSQDVHQISEEEQRANAKRQRNKKIKRYLLVGVATLGGGAVLGLTGGLAAPFMAAGAGAILGGAGAAALGSATGVAVIGSLFGVAGAGLTGYKMQKRVGGIEEFAFDPLTEGRHLHLALAVSGWLAEEESFSDPWLSLLHSREQYCLRYESSYLLQLGRAMDYLFSFALSFAAQEALKYTILSGLIAAITWPAALIAAAGVIDNPWSVCVRRSAEVGRHLADVLIQRQQGKRPVTLIGFSLGARVVYYCLQEMAKRKGSAGIVEDAVLLGAPVSAAPRHWRELSRVVSGRIVNGYCRGDWLLNFLYRTSSATLKIAGLQPIEWTDRRMCNVDLSSVVSGHMDYSNKMDTILRAVGVRTTDEARDGEGLRKSRSAAPPAGGNKHRQKPRSRSEGDLRRSSFEVPDCPAPGLPRDRSQSLDSGLSRSGSPGWTTPDGRRSPRPAPQGERSSTELLAPGSWDWTAWEEEVQ
ncbi:transmembrane and coiled-coil domain-containing protein 4-like [Uloborus diversus]|uniref:transmembrane and coiled-coil domain-containing protein 4-like n=1 Tax=Uloborus diversus TaxID=327109 RepID=UPI00240A7478|nr:transmembrane and coiled-coil domain-containing protein 4-like [Uloborus diversus]